MKEKIIRGQVEIDLGMDNFCYINTRNGRRVDLTEWMIKLDGKKVVIKVQEIKNEKKR